jgi:hypothetical protein
MAPPKPLYEYAEQFYEALLANAEQTLINNVEVKTFEGKLVELFSTLHISSSYYTPITRYLQDSGCMTVVKRGARSVLSVVVLHHKPDSETYNNFVTAFGSEKKEKKEEVSLLLRRLAAVEQATTDLAFLKNTSIDFENRISTIEQQMKDKERDV